MTAVAGMTSSTGGCSEVFGTISDQAARANPAEEPATPHRSAPLRLSDDQLAAAGIELVRLQPVHLQPELAAQGKVVDIGPLLELRTRYRATLAEYKIAEAALLLSQRNRDRMAKLSQEAIIATKELLQAESMLAADRTRAATTQQRLQEMREEAVHSWGSELFRLAIEEDSQLWQQLLKRQRVLLLIALPANTALPAGTRRVYVARNRDRQHATPAEWLAPAPNTDNFIQGETYFFTVDAQHLRTGMRVDAWIPRSGPNTNGVFLPASAVVWYGGLPWAYVKTGPGNFVRRAVIDYHEYGDGWYVERGFHGGEEVVAVGAQLLFSEEMHGQIPDERED